MARWQRHLGGVDVGHVKKIEKNCIIFDYKNNQRHKCEIQVGEIKMFTQHKERI